MMPFFNLFQQRARNPVAWADPSWADRQLPSLLNATPLRLWSPGDPISDWGIRLLVGVATWSGYDMRLLDILAERQIQGGVRVSDDDMRLLDIMAEGQQQGGIRISDVDVFNINNCRGHADFRLYIPSLRLVLQTPAVGIWVMGKLNWIGQGAEARDLVAHMFGSSSDEIVTFVMNWINVQRTVPPHESLSGT
jgi:hypothetical protein